MSASDLAGPHDMTPEDMAPEDMAPGDLRLVSGCKVFSATKAWERERLGERMTEWLAENPEHELVDVRVLQSSDSEFHCLSIVVFYAAS